MGKLLSGAITLAALAGLAGAAQAQDFFSGPAVNWTGPYVGAEGGYGWGSSNHGDSTGFNSGSFGANGGLAGGTLGFNWQTGPIVFGVEGDMSWADMSGSTQGQTGNFCGGSTPHCGTRLSDLGTVRGRVGYGFGTWLPYATGGLAVGNVHAGEGDNPINGASGQGSAYRAGWALGGGIEDAITPRWTAKVEYLHVDLGNGPIFTDTFASGATATERASFETDIIRGGINYKF
jgi:outer membrane immunogenic protein